MMHESRTELTCATPADRTQLRGSLTPRALLLGGFRGWLGCVFVRVRLGSLCLGSGTVTRVIVGSLGFGGLRVARVVVGRCRRGLRLGSASGAVRAELRQFRDVKRRADHLLIVVLL